MRLFGARSTGNFPTLYYFGGLDTLRGLDFREQIGNTVAFANFEFRFPLIDFLRLPDRRVPQHPRAGLPGRRRRGAEGPEVPVLGRERAPVDRRQGSSATG